MEKKVYFLSGFPRAGNTLLAKILNQNKNIAATGHSSLPDVFFYIESIKKTHAYNNFKNDKSIENIQKKLVLNFYKDWNQPYIIDRGEWGTPYNYKIIKNFCPNEFKIIFLLRNPLDIIKSYIKLCNDYPKFYINQEYNQINKNNLHRTELEEKIELITNKGTLFDVSCMAYNFIKNKKNVCFIRYENLIKDPKQTLDNIYNFLDIPKFKHTFNIKDQFLVNNISYNDDVIGAPMHTLHTGKLKNFNYPNIKLPKYIVEKYKNII